MGFSTAHDMQLQYKFSDPLGQLYVAIVIFWTIVLAGGITFLILNRKLPFIQIRDLPLTISAIVTLHIYWVLCFLAYGLNGFFPCDAEFWIMNIYLPLGIALFHASNAQLLYIAALQRSYVSSDESFSQHTMSEDDTTGWRGYLEKLRNRKGINKTKTYVGLGIVAQLALALLIFLISRKFHVFGVVGDTPSSTPEGRAGCRRGWEWMLSIAWQFFWAWIYAPLLLWKVRKIRDVHAWRLQTLCCCIAGLPASPMWLIAIYVPGMSRINPYFIPPLWFSPSIFLIEGFMIFVPCYQVLRNRRLKKKTLKIIAEWEQQKTGTSFESDTTKVDNTSRLSQKRSFVSTTSSKKAQPHMYTMIALEKALQTNSLPLLLFAALKDFSGENISFINHVLEWKQGWQEPQQMSPIRRMGPLANQTGPKTKRQLFEKAIGIYSSFVSLRTSKFPINISSPELKELEAVFEASAALVNADVIEANAITPFDDWGGSIGTDIEAFPSKDTVTTVKSRTESDSISHITSQQSDIIETFQMQDVSSKLPADLVIPTSFGPAIFDHALESIKYTVLTNTWPKFVNAGYAAQVDRGTIADRLQGRVSEYRSGWSRLLTM